MIITFNHSAKQLLILLKITDRYGCMFIYEPVMHDDSIIVHLSFNCDNDCTKFTAQRNIILQPFF